MTPPFALTPPQKRPEDILSGFMFGSGLPTDDDAPEGGGYALGADAPLAASVLRNSQADEVAEHAANDPTNPRLQALAAQQAQDQQRDPLSSSNLQARAKSDQDAADVISRFLNPQAEQMRARQSAEDGATAEAKAYGTGEGTARAAISPAGIAAARQTGDVDVRKGFAALGMTPPTTSAGGGTAVTPPSPAAQNTQQPNIAGAGPADTSAHNPVLDSPQAHQVLASVDPSTAAIVKAMVDYRMDVPGGYALARSPQMRQYVMLANQIDPTFDAGKYTAGLKLIDSFTSGPEGMRLQALNAAADHLHQLNDSREQLGNFNVGGPMLNGGINWLEQNLLGDGRQNGFSTNKGLLDAELGKFMGGSGATDHLRNSIGGNIDANSSDDQIRAYIDKVAELMGGQYGALRKQADALGIKHLSSAIDAMLGPQARKVVGMPDATQ